MSHSIQNVLFHPGLDMTSQFTLAVMESLHIQTRKRRTRIFSFTKKSLSLLRCTSGKSSRMRSSISWLNKNNSNVLDHWWCRSIYWFEWPSWDWGTGTFVYQQVCGSGKKFRYNLSNIQMRGAELGGLGRHRAGQGLHVLLWPQERCLCIEGDKEPEP